MGHSFRKRVVITGVGLVTPAGATLQRYWESITSGRSVLRTITLVDTSDLRISLAGEVDNSFFAEEDRPCWPDNQLDRTDRALLLCRSATRRALIDADVCLEPQMPLPIGISLGSGGGPCQATEEAYLAYARSGPRGARPKTVTRLMFNSISAQIAICFKLRGPQMTLASACASANMAMSRAVDLIRSGSIKQMVTGGVEMPLCRTVISAWAAMRVCSNATDKEQCSLPFHKRRAGLALAEGSAMFVFEELESALSRGARIYAEVLGYGENNDGTHITQPDANSQAEAIVQALRDADLKPEDIDYINAHGTGTELNDSCETEAIKRAFGHMAPRVPISSTKSVLGHGLGASGALELPAILGAFENQLLPPTANLDEIDPRCDLDYVPCSPRRAQVGKAISNSFAFGGANSVLVLGRCAPSSP